MPNSPDPPDTSLSPPLPTAAGRPRLAIIGGGSSGLICLKTALAELPGWDVVCLEQSGQIIGCWGHPYPGFVSTSTKYTTQFACFPEHEATVEPDSGASRAEFYREGEYGEYLLRFADAFGLRPHIRLYHRVQRLTRASPRPGWEVSYHVTVAPDPTREHTAYFDAVIICTGLTAQIKEIESPIPAIPLRELQSSQGLAGIRHERIVVFGGGESAVDLATRLSRPELHNQVFLSLRSGIRVSPRYHPIRGVPSDFLRNRLMLSIHPDLRNWLGQRFVEARILHRERFEAWFPSYRFRLEPGRPGARAEAAERDSEPQHEAVRKDWAYKLTKAAKDDLFNMFHNKSDDFLDCVAKGTLAIVGPPVDSRMESFYGFASREIVAVRPTKIVPAIGYRSSLHSFAGDSLKLADFYLGCCHVEHPDLYLAGFARPIIGNIPTISEMQAAYICGLIAGRFARPERIAELNAMDRQEHAARFARLNLKAVYPVEMFTYCDRLARHMDLNPGRLLGTSLRSWWRMQLSPATTMHYQFRDPQIRRFFDRAPVYMPPLLVGLLLMLKPLDGCYRFLEWSQRRLLQLWRRVPIGAAHGPAVCATMPEETSRQGDLTGSEAK